MTDKVSIIIPVYNTGNLLRRCLDSVLAQSYSNTEIICIDDCSTDDSPSVLREYADRYDDKFKVIFNSENIGQGRGRMKGISVSDGEYIFFVDSDDYIAEDYVDTYMKEVSGEKYDVVVGGFVRDEEGKKYEHHIDQNIGSVISYSHACCKMYRKDFILDNGISFGDFRKGEDIYFSLMLVMKDAKHKFIDYCGYYYYLNNSSTTRTMNYNTNFERIVSDIFDKILADCGSLSRKHRKYLEYAYVSGMINALLVYNKGCTVKECMNKYNYFLEDLKKKFPNYKTNKLLFRLQTLGPSLKCRLGVWVFMNGIKYKVDKGIVLLFSVFNSF